MADEKLPYGAPELTTYGSLAELTEGGLRLGARDAFPTRQPHPETRLSGAGS